MLLNMFLIFLAEKKGAGTISLRRPGIVTGMLPVWSVVRYSAADGVTVSLAGYEAKLRVKS